MDAQRFTQKSQEALQDAQSEAIRRGNTEVDVEHVVAALLRQEGGLIPRLFQKMEVDSQAVLQAIEEDL
jgi:ATP-dependent Clp protease ATP-binding subunit ClpB